VNYHARPLFFGSCPWEKGAGVRWLLIDTVLWPAAGWICWLMRLLFLAMWPTMICGFYSHFILFYSTSFYFQFASDGIIFGTRGGQTVKLIALLAARGNTIKLVWRVLQYGCLGLFYKWVYKWVTQIGQLTFVGVFRHFRGREDH